MRNRSSGDGVYVFALVLIIPLIIWDGFVISVIWNWFMPKIFGLVHLSIAQAIGLSIMISILVSRGRNNNEDETLLTLLAPFIYGVIALLTGFIVQMFI